MLDLLCVLTVISTMFEAAGDEIQYLLLPYADLLLGWDESDVAA